jgi:hypothetical protein
MGNRYLLDEDVSHGLAGALRAAGLDADSAKELGHLGFTDVMVLTRAADLGRILITHNKKDMLLLHEAWLTWRVRWEATEHPRASHPGILLTPHQPVLDLVRLVEEFDSAESEATNRLFSWNAQDRWHQVARRIA